MTFVLPGTNLPALSFPLSPGLSSSKSSVTPTHAGILSGSLLRFSSRRYTPTFPDYVLGTITHRHSEGFRVDLGSCSASLDSLAFEGATKRNKPNVKVGDVVYAKVMQSDDVNAEAEITCDGPGLGELKGGFLLTGLDLGLCMALLSQKSALIQQLSASVGSRFELAIGLNNAIWIGGDDEAIIKVAEVLRSMGGR